jgi:subtilisin family serine protease
MVNNSGDLPPFEGKITRNPDDGVPFTVTIPFLGVAGGANPSTSPNGQKFIAANGTPLTLTGVTIANPAFKALASFSSFGPATGDSSLKPNVTAPGVSIASAGVGTGNEAATMSGTSMAAPHTAGMAALVKQSHPDWRKVKYWAAAIENTADPGGVSNYSTRGAGTGFIQAVAATQTQVVALGTHDAGSLSFGFAELKRDYSEQQTITLKNLGDSSATFTVSDALPQGSPHTTTFSSSVVTVPAGGDRDVRVRLTVPAGTAGGPTTPCAPVTCLTSPFSQVAGLVTFTPTSSSNAGVTLRVPYSLAPQEVSQVDVRPIGRVAAKVTNKGPADGVADWYQWGIKDKRDHGLGSSDILAVGAQAFPADNLLVFSIATRHRWSNAAQNEFDINVDVNNDGVDDYLVVAADFGGLTTGDFDGVTAVAVFDLNEGGGGSIDFVADSPVDSSTMTLPVDFSQLQDSKPATSLGGANQTFTYGITSFGLTDNTSDTGDMTARFNPFNPAVNNGMFDTVAPGGTAVEQLTVNAAQQAQQQALGWLVVSHENEEKSEANFVDIKDVRH